MPRKTFTGSVCGHVATIRDAKYCRACWRARGGDGERKTYKASVCGHACSTVNLKYCRDCYDRKRVVTRNSSDDPTSHPATLAVKGNTAEVGRITDINVRTLEDLIRVCELDTSVWIVLRWVANKWEMGAKDADGHLVSRPLYQIKAWLVRNVAVISARAEIDALIAAAKAAMPALKAIKRRPQPSSGLMLELNVADLHIGKLAWAPETGHHHYDSSIAEAEHDRAVETIMGRCGGYALDEILIVLGNDLLHVDNRANATTAGTAQDTDSRYYKVFLATRRMAQRMIERCRTLARVRVVLVPGNHDRDSVWHLGDSLACLYETCPGVTIDNAPSQRKYVEHGRVMLMLTHGHKGKRDDYPLLMATERSEMFGRTRYREVHTGHLHTTRVQEFHGVRVRILPSLAGIDAWHAEEGFVGNVRAAEAFVWSADEGLITAAYYNAPIGQVTQ